MRHQLARMARSFGPDWYPGSPWSKYETILSVNYGSIGTTISTATAGPNLQGGAILLDSYRVLTFPLANPQFNGAVHDLANNTVTTIFMGDNVKFSGACLLNDGRVFLAPSTGSTSRIYNPVTGSVTSAPSFASSGYSGCVYMDNDKVFVVPSGSATAGIYDVATGLVSNIGSFPAGTPYLSGVRLKDGRVLCVPYNATQAAIYDPTSNSFSLSGTFPGLQSFAGACLMADGRVFLCPANNTSARIYNSDTDTWTTPGGAYGAQNVARRGAILMPDTRIFCIPSNAASATIYDPSLNTVTNVSGFPGSNGLYGGCLLRDGRLFLANYSSASPRIFGSALNADLPDLRILSPLTNKAL